MEENAHEIANGYFKITRKRSGNGLSLLCKKKVNINK